MRYAFFVATARNNNRVCSSPPQTLVCHLRCGDAVDCVYSLYSGLVVYAARLKWQGLVANLWFATFGVGNAGYCWDSGYVCYTEYAATR